MLSRFAVMMYQVCICSGSKGQIEIFVRETSRFLALYSPYFCFLGANFCNLFYACSTFGSLGEVFAHGGEFPPSFLKVVGLGHGVEKYC